MDQRFTEGVNDCEAGIGEISPLDRADKPGDIQPPVSASQGLLVERQMAHGLETGANEEIEK